MRRALDGITWPPAFLGMWTQSCFVRKRQGIQPGFNRKLFAGEDLGVADTTGSHTISISLLVPC